MTFEIIDEFEENGKTYANFEMEGLPAICEIINGSLNGKCIQYIEDSITLEKTVLKIVHYIDSVLNGLYQIFNKKQIVLQEGYYIDGKISGVVKHYNSEGLLQSTYTYVDGVLNGENRFYNRNSICTSIQNFKDGKSHGKQSIMDSHGNLMSVWHCENGFFVGEHIVYSSFGDVLSSYMYSVEDGVSIGYNAVKDCIKFQSLPIEINVDLMCNLFFEPKTFDTNEDVVYISSEEHERLKHIIYCKKHFTSFLRIMEKLKVKLNLSYFD